MSLSKYVLDQCQTHILNTKGGVSLTHKAHEGRIIAAGAGGAVYHHIAPDDRQSQAAAAALVTQVFGPQTGELRGIFGPLLRQSPPQERSSQHRAPSPPRPSPGDGTRQ